MFLEGLVKENAATQLQPPSELVLQALYKTMLQSSSSLQTRFSHHWYKGLVTENAANQFLQTRFPKGFVKENVSNQRQSQPKPFFVDL